MPLVLPGVVRLVMDKVDRSLLGARRFFRVNALLNVSLGFFSGMGHWSAAANVF